MYVDSVPWMGMKSWWGGVVYASRCGKMARGISLGWGRISAPSHRRPSRSSSAGVVLQGVELLQPVDGADHGHVLRLRLHGEAVEIGQGLGGVGAVQEPAGVAGEAEEAPAHALQVVDGQQVPHEEVAVAVHAPRQLGTVVDGVGGIEKGFHALPRG